MNCLRSVSEGKTTSQPGPLAQERSSFTPDPNTELAHGDWRL